MRTSHPDLWSIGSGKGGVGKTMLLASIGILLARMGRSVIVVNAALGSSNLHTYLGIKSPRSILRELPSHHVKDSEVLVPTSQPGLRLLACAADISGAADPAAADRDTLMRFITRLEADCVLIDTRSGTSCNTLDLFNLCEHRILAVTPDPASIRNAYGFLRRAVYRCILARFGTNAAVNAALKQTRDNSGKTRNHTMMDFCELLSNSDSAAAEAVAALVDGYHPYILVNMATSEEDQGVAEILQATCKRSLNVDTRFCGFVNTDQAVQKAAQRESLVDLDDASVRFSQQIRQIVHRLINYGGTVEGKESGQPEDLAAVTPIMGLNDNLEFIGSTFHIQTEDSGYIARCITTQVFRNGQVVLSAKSEYPSAVNCQRDREQITDLMRKQHFEILRELECKKIRLLRPTSPQ